MNNPINDIPVYTPPSNSNLLDTFEVWLQGRINVCVGGHAGRIARLEERLQTQDGYIKHLEETIDKLANRVQAMLVPETMPADELLVKIRSADEWPNALKELLDTSAFERAIERNLDIERLVTMSDVTEAIDDWSNDSGFNDSVKEVINSMSFKVTVS